jgi:hypothetical protein
MTGDLSVIGKLAKVRALFPRKFDPIIESLKVGVKSITVRSSILGIPASYDPEKEAISINPDADWAKIAAQINARHPGLKIIPEHAIVFMVLHEFGHSLRRKQVLAMPHRNLLNIKDSAFFFMDQREIFVEEYEADLYAKKRFLEWRGRP